MKRTLIFALLFLAALSAPPRVLAAGTANNDNAIHVSLGMRGWLSQADAKWQISFPHVTGAGQSGTIESELNFDNIDSPMVMITGGIGIGPYFSLEGLLGRGSIGDGRNTDTDRFLPNSASGLEFSQSTSDLDGNVKLGELNFYYNNHRFTGKSGSPWGAVFGYSHYQDELHMTHGVQTVSIPFDGALFPPLGPFPPTQVLNSDFRFTWNAIKLGILPQFEVTDQLSVTGMFSFYPYVNYRGEGYWNLRAGSGQTDFRAESPNFIQKSTRGYGYEATLGAVYAISENVDLSAGYQYFSLRAIDGIDTVYFANGSSADSTLDWATVARHGMYAEVLYKF
jgi:hypothetical protein